MDLNTLSACGAIFSFMVAALAHFYPQSIVPSIERNGCPRRPTKEEVEILMGKTNEDRLKTVRSAKLLFIIQGVFFASLPWTFNWFSSTFIDLGAQTFEAVEELKKSRTE